MKIPRSIRILLLAVAVLAIAVAGCTRTGTTTAGSVVAGGTPATSGAAATAGAIKLTSDDNGQYSPSEIRVKVGSTVRVEGDLETLVGGMDTVIVDGYGIRKKIVPGDNRIEFVAGTPGTFDVKCANGMGNGLLVVEA